MKISFHKNFIKQYNKLPDKEQKQVKEKLTIFLENPYTEQLNNHSLKGKYLNYRSINFNGDARAIYKYLDENESVFVNIGTHHQLYSK